MLIVAIMSKTFKSSINMQYYGNIMYNNTYFSAMCFANQRKYTKFIFDKNLQSTYFSDTLRLYDVITMAS